jgi:hypothetical protein
VTILQPGSFRVSDFRKPIPEKVKRQVVARGHEFDHDPALNARPYDTDAGDFIPPQHDPDFIVLRRNGEHDEKTFGRKEGAERTVTTRGSDVGEAARITDIQLSEAIHKAAMASKRGEYRRAAEILATAPKRKLKVKRKIPSRPFAKGRKFRAGANDQRNSRRGA